MSVHVAYLQCCRSPLLFHIFLHTALHADWVTIAMTEWLIDLSGDGERGLRRGGEGGCMATGCKRFLQLPRSAFKPLAPPTSFFFQRSLLIIAESHSAAGENKHCFIYTSRAVNEPLWTALLGQHTMRYMRERLFSDSPRRDDARGLSDILISAAALRSAVAPAGFPDAVLHFVDIKGVIALVDTSDWLSSTSLVDADIAYVCNSADCDADRLLNECVSVIYSVGYWHRNRRKVKNLRFVFENQKSLAPALRALSTSERRRARSSLKER